MEKFATLKNRLIEISDIRSATALLYWDQATYMPSEGAKARGRQIATLRRIAHEKFTSDEIGKLLDDLRSYEKSLDYDSDQASLIRVTRSNYEKAIKMPADFTAEFSSHATASYQAWTKARPQNDFEIMKPFLEKTLDLSRRMADFFPGYEHIADPLIDFGDEGMTVKTIRSVFSDLREKLVTLVKEIADRPIPETSCLHGDFPIDDQYDFGKSVISQFGFDFDRGRQDETHHPFMTKFSINDVRITTRSKIDDIGDALFSTMHEAGHAFYELGIDQSFEGSPLGGGTSSGVHESQSRLWENVVGRSRGFWTHFFPKLQNAFSDHLESVSVDQFYRAINKVERSLIRTDADEVTYNLHVMLRFDLELDLLEGNLKIEDLADAWKDRFKADFGLDVPDDRDGVLQDVHWFHGKIGGAFQGYTLGNILSAQFFAKAIDANRSIPSEIENGEFETLHNWLRENIYRHGSKYTAPELIRRVTDEDLTIEPYVRYLQTKYGELYEL